MSIEHKLFDILHTMHHREGTPYATWHFEANADNLPRELALTLSVQTHISDEAAFFLDTRQDFHGARPAATFSDSTSDIYAACWHRGAHFDYLLVGDPDHVMQYCDLSSGERESILLNARRLGPEGTAVYAVATGTYNKLHPSLPDLRKTERLTMCGLVAAAA